MMKKMENKLESNRKSLKEMRNELKEAQKELVDAKKNSFGQVLKRTILEAIDWVPLIALGGYCLMGWAQGQGAPKYACDYVRAPL